jgi:hypothetical protein
VTWAIGAVVVLLVGLPLAAVWWSRRAMWSKLRAGRDSDPFGDTMRRHGLGPAAMARVENAVLWGKRLDDPAERAAVVDLARTSMPRRPTSRSRAWIVVGASAWLAVLVAGAVWIAVEGRWDDVPWIPLVFAALGGWGAGLPARAVRRNSDSPLQPGDREVVAGDTP